ncbi:MAG: hypothetical protein Q4F74_03785 [Synergistaceae bacterium]|nr:hypothetical protein [Synergistaceae bacterium]
MTNNNIVKKLSKMAAGSMIMVMLATGCSFAAPNDMGRGGQPGGQPQRIQQPVRNDNHQPSRGGVSYREPQHREQPMQRNVPQPQRHVQSRPQPHRDSGRSSSSTNWGLAAIGAIVGGILVSAISSNN